jgi:mannose-1-phosphate guanylyltransferase
VKAHERFYADELADVRPSRVVVQPSNKGTTAAIICSLLRITRLAVDPIVGFFPTDHHYSREMRFAAAVRLALKIAASRPNTIILMGASAEHPEVEYGWIEPGSSLEGPFGNSLLRVLRFWEKPPIQVAQTLHSRGCLWNTFVMIGRASSFLGIIGAAAPEILQILREGCRPEGTPQFAAGVDAYAALSPEDFSQQVLSVSTAQLAVLPLGNIGWSDLGTPERVTRAMTRWGLRSDWVGSGQNETVESLSKVPVS